MMLFRRECPVSQAKKAMQDAARSLDAAADKVIAELAVNGHKLKDVVKGRGTK